MAIAVENRSRGLRWYYANKEKARENQRVWYALMREEDPAYCTARSRHRRHRRRAAGPCLGQGALGDIEVAAGGVCSYCLQAGSLVLEHCTPIARGGLNTEDNVVMACASCNGRKGAKTPLEFLMNWGQ